MKRMMKAASAAAGVWGIKPRQKQSSGVSDLLKDQVQVSYYFIEIQDGWSDVFEDMTFSSFCGGVH